MQYKEAWSNLDKMYFIHDESFFIEMFSMSIVQEVVTSDHFPVCFEFNQHAVDRVPLRFNSSLLFHYLFDAYLQQIFGMFSEHVNFKGMACMGYNIKKHQ